MSSQGNIQFWVNGQAAKQISLQDRAFAYGDGLFATMRVDSQGQVQFLDCHLAKAAQGALRLGFDWQLSETSRVLLLRLAKENPNTCIKLQISRGVGGRGYSAPVNPIINEVLSVHSIPAHYQVWQQQGISLKQSELQLGMQPRLAGIKHCNRLEQVLIKSQDLPQEFDDFWVSDIQGNVIEASMANLFVLIDGHWHTPSLAYAGVAGMMRRQVIQALIELGHNVRLGPVTIEQVKQANTLLMTNSLLGVVGVRRIDDSLIPSDELSQSLSMAEQLRKKLQLI